MMTRLQGCRLSGLSFPMLARLHIPVFLGSFYPDIIDHRLHLLQNPVDIKIDMQNNESKFALGQVLKMTGRSPRID